MSLYVAQLCESYTSMRAKTMIEFIGDLIAIGLSETFGVPKLPAALGSGICPWVISFPCRCEWCVGGGFRSSYRDTSKTFAPKVQYCRYREMPKVCKRDSPFLRTVFYYGDVVSKTDMVWGDLQASDSGMYLDFRRSHCVCRGNALCIN